MKRSDRSRTRNDPVRRRAIDAAIRHAERVVQSTGTTEPVLYRPASATAARPPKTDGRRNVDVPANASANPTMELALCEALRLPARAAPAQTRQSTIGRPGKASIAGPASIAAKKDVAPTRPNTVPSASTPKAVKPSAKPKRKKSTSGGQNVGPQKIKAKKKAAPLPTVIRKPVAPGPNRRKGAAANAASRLAFNARIREGADGQTTPPSPFIGLKRRWQAAFAYLQRFEEANPDAPDVLAARMRLAEVEAEWDRRHSLEPDHPDYFPWPSTDADVGSGSVATSEWQEIGMFAYLGYHVGATSTLTAAQRTSLLGRIFVMRLPPLNGVGYMRHWGSPDTGARLHKMADGLASFARNAKRRESSAYGEAIRQWENDLSYLRRSFYEGRFDFPWPAS